MKKLHIFTYAMSKIYTDKKVKGVDSKVPDAPNAGGKYVLKSVVNNGTKTYQWVPESETTGWVGKDSE